MVGFTDVYGVLHMIITAYVTAVSANKSAKGLLSISCDFPDVEQQ